jgi:hypothetical protein
MQGIGSPADLQQKQARSGMTREPLLAAFLLQKQPKTAGG